KAWSRESRRRPPFCFFSPWHCTQYVVSSGCTSLTKSIGRCTSAARRGGAAAWPTASATKAAKQQAARMVGSAEEGSGELVHHARWQRGRARKTSRLLVPSQGWHLICEMFACT